MLKRHYTTLHVKEDNDLSKLRMCLNGESSCSTEAPDSGISFQPGIAPYLNNLNPNILDMNIPKMIDNKEMLSIETPIETSLYEHTFELSELYSGSQVSEQVISANSEHQTLTTIDTSSLSTTDNPRIIGQVTVVPNNHGATPMTPAVDDMTTSTLKADLVFIQGLATTSKSSVVPPDIKTDPDNHTGLVTTPETPVAGKTTPKANNINQLAITSKSPVVNNTPEKITHENVANLIGKNTPRTQSLIIETLEPPPPIDPQEDIVLTSRNHPATMYSPISPTPLKGTMYLKEDDMDTQDGVLIQTVTAASSIPDKECKDFMDNKAPNNATCKNPGVQVSVFDFLRLPVPGNIYRVNKDHQFVALKFIPGEVYQADERGVLQPIGLFNFHMDADSSNLP